MKDIGINIRHIRELKNLRRVFVAQKLGITNSALGRIERGESKVSINRLAKIAEILEVSIDEIISFDINKTLSQENGKFDKNKNETVSRSHDAMKAELESLRNENAYLRSVLERLLSRKGEF